MTSDERSKILRMIEEGKISAEEGLQLMQVLDNEPDEDSVDISEVHSFSSSDINDRPTPEHDPEIKRTTEKARSLWMIPLWIGVAVTILGSWIMYSNMLPAAGFNGLFYCLGLPILILGILIILLGLSSRTSRWLFVSVKQGNGEWPQRIRFGFPLPLGLASWFFRNFGKHIDGVRHVPVEQILEALNETSDPLVVNVDDDDDGDKVQVYIG